MSSSLYSAGYQEFPDWTMGGQDLSNNLHLVKVLTSDIANMSIQKVQKTYMQMGTDTVIRVNCPCPEQG